MYKLQTRKTEIDKVFQISGKKYNLPHSSPSTLALHISYANHRAWITKKKHHQFPFHLQPNVHLYLSLVNFVFISIESFLLHFYAYNDAMYTSSYGSISISDCSLAAFHSTATNRIYDPVPRAPRKSFCIFHFVQKLPAGEK